MDSDRRMDMRALSKRAFGQAYMLELMIEIERRDDGIFTLSDASKTLGVSVSNLQGPVENLVALSLITRLPLTDTKGVFYIRNESAAWVWANELREQIALDLA